MNLKEPFQQLFQSRLSLIGELLRLLPVAASIGLLTGILEGILYLFFSSQPGQIPWELRWLGVSIDILWISPLFDLVLFVTVILGLVFAAWIFNRSIPLKIAFGILAFLSIFDLFSLTGTIYPLAALIFSLGASFTLVRWLEGYRTKAKQWRNQIVAGLALAVGMIFLTTRIGVVVYEQKQISQLPQATQGAPNVLLIVLDTLRADHLSAYGYSRNTTPNIDNLAKQGVLFKNAYANAPWTLSSHATMMTGSYVYQHQADGDVPLDNRLPTLAEELKKRGYVTAGFVANTYWTGRRSGIGRGFIHYDDYFGSLGDMVARTVYGRKMVKYVLPHLGYNDILGRKRATDINRNFLSWLKQKPDRPFFVFLNYMDVHDPYIPPPNFREVYSKHIDEGDLMNFLNNKFFVGKNLTPSEVQMVVDSYDSSLSYLDHELGKLFDTLNQEGILDHTLVILVSDHGESFGENGVFGHGNSLDFEQLHVPLIIRYPPQVQPGEQVATPVGLNQLAVSVLNTVDPSHASVFPGISLLKVAGQGSNEIAQGLPGILSEKSQVIGAPENWPVGKGWLKSLITENRQFVLQQDGTYHVYAIQNGHLQPNSVTNNQPDLAQKFKASLLGLSNQSLSGNGSLAH